MLRVIGIDEVGRGSLAGPVTVCAADVPASARFRWSGAPTVLRDSKRLSLVAREAWVRYLRSRSDVRWAIASESARTVDRIGISAAANRAAGRVVVKLVCHHGDVGRPHGGYRVPTVYLDAGLRLPPSMIRKLGIRQIRSFPKADERVPAVAIASIIAKVHRDRHLARLHHRYPTYDFAAHKGYGTAAHRRTIRRHGPSAEHRLTFLGSSVRMKKNIALWEAYQ